MQNHPLISILTDFGEKDFFVASLKGVIAGINPSARVIDITHQIPSYNIQTGSFVLDAVCRYFPDRTIFLVIIDPGVGSSRRILLVETKKYFFIAPDNGVLGLVLEREKAIHIRKIENKKYFLPYTSTTFEGRDKMAPAAAWLSTGVPAEKFGPEIYQVKRIHLPKPKIKGSEVLGQVLYVDKFGNLITNIPPKILDSIRHKAGEGQLLLMAGSEKIISFKKNYSHSKKGELLCLIGSLGLVEIAVREGSAAKKLEMKAGDCVKLNEQI